MNKIWTKYRAWIIITAIFVLFIAFIAPGSFIKTAGVKHRINKLKSEQREYRAQIKSDSTFLENLKDDEFLEDYAREHLYMKRKGEEIYIIER